MHLSSERNRAQFTDTIEGVPVLSDVFVDRYEMVSVWTIWSSVERKLLVQCAQILKEDLFPVAKRNDGTDFNEKYWRDASQKLCRELGIPSLAPAGYRDAKGHWWTNSVRAQALQFLQGTPAPDADVDRFIKERLSFVELLFRSAHEECQKNEAGRSQSFLGEILSHQARILQIASDELNVRFARAGAPLNYHSGFIQVSRDTVLAREIERPFWALVDHPRWSNVDLEMKEAIDRRDSNEPDAAFFAGKALESAIKVIGHDRNWTTGKEKGAADHTGNLYSAAEDRILAEWQVQSIKFIFARLRNPFGHGAGAGEPPSLSVAEIDWAIAMSMNWIALLVRKHEEFLQAA